MHDAPARDDEIVRSARIDEGADAGRNDRRTRIVWASGFIDGEGSIGVNSNMAGRASKSLILSLQVSQVNPLPLYLLRDLFGGSVLGPRAAKGKRRAYFAWRIAGRMAARALREMEPHLTVKREEARLGLRFQALLGGVRQRPLNEWEIAERESFREALIEAHAFSWG